MKKSSIMAVTLIMLSLFCYHLTVAAPVTVSTGNLGNNVISGSDLYVVSLTAETPSNSIVSEIAITYGLWNSPPVDVSVSFNTLQVVGNFLAYESYLSDPITAFFDVTGLVVDGINQISFIGTNQSAGDYIIGQVDLSYDNSGNSSAPVPEPSTMILLATGLIGLTCYGTKRLV